MADAQARLDDTEFTKLALERLAALPAWTADVAARLRPLHPLPGSRFEDDDLMKPTNPPSEQVMNLMRSALDHLQALAGAVEGDGLRPLASFTLIRSALEASAIATWLMLPGVKDKRLKNSIRLSVENRRDTETYIKRFISDDRVSNWFRDEMTATKNRRPGTKNMDIEAPFPTLTSIILDTDKKQKFDALAGIDVWRACSGIAHSNAQFAGASTSTTASESELRVTVKATSLIMMLIPAQQYVEFSLSLVERHMATPAARRKVSA
jgi:hypothetical protein